MLGRETTHVIPLHRGVDANALLCRHAEHYGLISNSYLYPWQLLAYHTGPLSWIRLFAVYD